MKLVIVDRSKAATFDRMRHLFAGDPNVIVMWDRRSPEERRRREAVRAPDRRTKERRVRMTDFGGRGFIVVEADASDLMHL